MTQPTLPQTVFEVTPKPGTRLDALLAEYETAKAWAAEADARLKAVTDGIKAELGALAPGVQQIEVAHPAVHTRLRMTHVVSWRVDSAALKREHPELYVQYAKSSESWRLAGVKG